MTDVIYDDSDLRKYRIELPNMADDELDPYEFRLYAHYKRVCGAKGGRCYESVRTTAKNTKMSVGKVVSTREILKHKGWITIGDSEYGTLEIRIIDRWLENFQRYHKCSPDERGCSGGEPKKEQDKKKINSPNGDTIEY